MRKFLLTLGAAATLVTGMVASGTTAASADPYYGRHYGGWRGDDYGWRRHHDRGWRGGDALAAGAVGLGVGALLGGAIASSNRPVYYDDGYYGDEQILEGPVQRRVYYRPAPVYRSAPTYYRPARAYNHTSACLARYQSYNPRTDSFLGYDGYWHRCNL